MKPFRATVLALHPSRLHGAVVTLLDETSTELRIPIPSKDVGAWAAMLGKNGEVAIAAGVAVSEETRRDVDGIFSRSPESLGLADAIRADLVAARNAFRVELEAWRNEIASQPDSERRNAKIAYIDAELAYLRESEAQFPPITLKEASGE